MARQSTFRSIQLWQTIPVAGILHGVLLWLPIQTGTSKLPEPPKPVEATVKLSALPSPSTTMPKPSPSPSPSVKPVVLPPVSQAVLPQTLRQVVQPAAVQSVQSFVAPTPAAVVPLASPQAKPQVSSNPQVSPPPKTLDTTADMLSHLGGQSCGLGCFQVGDKTLGDVISQFQQRFGTAPEEIRDNNTDMLLGYTITNRKGEKEYLYYYSVATNTVGQSSLIHSFRQLPELITDREQLVARGVM